MIDAIEDALGSLERDLLTTDGKTVRVAAICHRSVSYGSDPR